MGDTARTTRAHPPAKGEARKAADAALPPAGDRDAQAKAAQVEKMAGAKPAGFDKAAFMAAVRAAIAAKAPKNLDEADRFAESGRADGVKAEVMGNVAKGKDASAKDIATKTSEAPDPSVAKDKPVTPLSPDPVPKPAVPAARAGMPAPAPAPQTDLGAPKTETDAQMAEADVTEDQLARSNEPEFTGALAAKKAGEEHSATAPSAVRAGETATLEGAAGGADQAAVNLVGQMAGKKAAVTSQASGQKEEARSADTAVRERIKGELTKIFTDTKTEVTKILSDLDAAVATRFDEGEKLAKAAFTADHKARMGRYKDERYSGVVGAGRWVADKFAGLPAEANQLFQESRKLYEAKMEGVISSVADLIGGELARAKGVIARGRESVARYLSTQPKELAKVAGQAAKDIGGEFDKLEADVDDKQSQLVDDLAQRYVDARSAVDEEIKALQDENKGLWDKAKEAVGGAIETILKLKSMLLGVLSRAAGAVGKIIKDPIGFLGNLIGAVRSGVMGFAANIVDHLKKGLQGWLFGSLADAGIEIPDSFDLKGIIKLVLSILGLTWTRIRTKIVGRIGEAAMNAVERGSEIFKTLVSEGVGGLWKFLVDKLSDLKDTVMSAIQDFVVVKIVKAGITWLISALNPAAAFIKACKMIYDVVMFFVEKGSQIKEFVDSVLDSIESIVGGGVGAVAKHIENTLAKILPLLIGFLASLLGLGGISEKIKEILKKVQEPVEKAVDFVINGALKLARPIINLVKRGAAWVKGKFEKGKAWVKGKVEAGKAWAKGKVDAAKGRLGLGPEPASGQPPAGLAANQDAMTPAEVKAAVAADIGPKLAAKPVSADEAQRILSAAQARFGPKGLTRLYLEPKDGRAGAYTVLAVASPASPVADALAEVKMNIKDLDFREGTVCVAELNGTLVERRRASKGAHAEEQILGILNARWASLVPDRNSDARLVLKITRSPCGPGQPDKGEVHDCAGQIQSFAMLKKRDHPKFELKLQVASIYEGEGSRRIGESMINLQELQDAGHQIELWDIVREIESRLGRKLTDADLDPETRGKLEQKARIVNGVLKTFGHLHTGG